MKLLLCGLWSALSVVGLVPTARAKVAPQALYQEGDQVPAARTFHILVRSEAQARSLLRHIQARPGTAPFKTFQKLARQHSLDGGSARTGGDLGLVYPGEMVVAFERAVFASAIGAVTGPVQSEFGWHLIYVSEVHTEPVSTLCDRSVQLATAMAEASVKEGLSLLSAIDPAVFADKVKALLGEGWTGPFKDGEGQLLFLSIMPAAPGDRIKTVRRHIEWHKARLATSHAPLACSRSFIDAWAFDCVARTIGFSSLTEHEGRAGKGRTTRHIDVALPQIQFRAINPGNAELQLYNYACQGDSPLLRP